ncbi:S8 family peptidase [Chitinophaga pinensis]|uniref:Peptidase S8 and S53 subtilisin kexin sedolisin n=1 Tax=Chitinophaga pinensis (strain ATCC 43595 / DSM 2588 / LMG 13176 / NBRC 15968 / NCIMB 11800 / UQM 2034) TaxID=485918 RepID=A0A979G5H2_CHIPD|nr:S8/S53 family peptidase [Chitinophaga pinensis]ACU61091.1 peptidase S8 and S53 subtilisin kexin sedolisin [Chitinophaga pinensis DSM 2588]
MRTPYFMMVGVAFVLFTSCRKTDTPYTVPPAQENPEEVISKSAINAFVHQQLETYGYFDWKMASDTMVWSALLHGDSILSVGYTTNSNADEVLQLTGQQMALLRPVRTATSDKLHFMQLHVSSYATVKALRSSAKIRYAEPVGYGNYMRDVNPRDAAAASDILTSGCGYNNAKTDLVAGTDYTVISPAAKLSWNYGYHRIEQAWQRSTGQRIKVMIIDTGVSPQQENLGSAFNQGLSTGRTIQKLGTYNSSPDDPCGHGTSMAGVLAGPRGTDGNTAGIAYNCDLAIVHAAENVVLLSTAAINGVTYAYVQGADDPAVKIISMSMGTLFSSGQIKDALVYAYSKQKLMFCAAGTSTSFFAGFVGVIFPANQPQVVAVTGMKDNLKDRCDNCHTGSKVDFAIVMQKSSGRNPLSIAMNGDAPSTVGGSSVATASCAAIAALVWSKYPSYPRDSIIARMARASGFANSRSSKFGWGIINADAAVGY